MRSRFTTSAVPSIFQYQREEPLTAAKFDGNCLAIGLLNFSWKFVLNDMQKILRLAEQNQSAKRKKTKVENFFSSWFFGKKKKKGHPNLWRQNDKALYHVNHSREGFRSQLCFASISTALSRKTRLPRFVSKAFLDILTKFFSHIWK